MNNDNLTNSPLPGVSNPGGNSSTDFSSTPRYASVEEMQSEFGDYRVNKETDRLVDSQKPTDIASDRVVNDPFSIDMDNTDSN